MTNHLDVHDVPGIDVPTIDVAAIDVADLDLPGSDAADHEDEGAELPGARNEIEAQIRRWKKEV